MNFRDVLLWVVVIFFGSLYLQFNIWLVLDTYYTRKEQHISKMSDVLAIAIKKMSEENKDA